jgi:DNA repair photolyase
MKRTEFVPYKTRSILNKHKRPDTWFWIRYTAYPYIGCQHGCEFCYCREKKYAPYDEVSLFSSRIKVKENAPALLRKALMKAKVDAVAVGDYQPAERKYELSRRMLEVCADLRFPVFILERSPLVLRDLDLLQEINRQTYVTVVFSIIHTAYSPDADIISRIERLAPPPEERFRAMQVLAEKGIRTGISFMPILPELCDTDENIDLVIRQTKDNGGQFVLAGPLTLANQQKQYFFNFLESNFPNLLPVYKDFYPQKSYAPPGGYWRNVGLKVRQTCKKYDVPDRMPRPLIPGEKRVLNKQIVQMLSDKTYNMELDGDPEYRIWSYRKAAWAVEDMEQDIGLVYAQMGRKGLESIPAIGKSISKEIESSILALKQERLE